MRKKLGWVKEVLHKRVHIMILVNWGSGIGKLVYGEKIRTVVPWRWGWTEMKEDEMAGWHHWLDGRESGWTPGVSDGQGGLACCDSWGCKGSDTTELLNWTIIVVVGESVGLKKGKIPVGQDYSNEDEAGKLISLEIRKLCAFRKGWLSYW